MSRRANAGWWALVMGAAASIEDAAAALRDQDARRQAEGAAKHYRNAANELAEAEEIDAADKRFPLE